MDQEHQERLINMNDEELIEEFAHVAAVSDEFRVQIGFMRMLITQRMENNNATVMRGSEHNVVGTTKTEYDYSILASLREYLDPEELKGMYTPEHDEVVRVPEKWNMTRAKKLLKLGAPYSEIINDAKMTVGRMSIKLEERKSLSDHMADDLEERKSL